MFRNDLTSRLAIPFAVVIALAATACGGPSAPAPEAASPATATAPAAMEPAPADEPSTDEAAVAEREAHEQELAAKEAELEAREAELAAREAAAKAPAKAPAKTSTAARPAASAPAQETKAAAPPPPVTVPAGTQLAVALAAPVTTKTAAVGDPVEARLASDLVVDGRRVAKAGAAVSGSVSEVVSGSKKIGATPTLKVAFRQLALADGTTVAIDGEAVQKGQSEKGRDTAKIVGGTAAGAIIGHQIDDDKGKVIGGILGGAAGAVAAQKTGTEVALAEGDALSFALRNSFEYKGK